MISIRKALKQSAMPPLPGQPSPAAVRCQGEAEPAIGHRETGLCSEKPAQTCVCKGLGACASLAPDAQNGNCGLNSGFQNGDCGWHHCAGVVGGSYHHFFNFSQLWWRWCVWAHCGSCLLSPLRRRRRPLRRSRLGLRNRARHNPETRYRNGLARSQHTRHRLFRPVPFLSSPDFGYRRAPLRLKTVQPLHRPTTSVPARLKPSPRILPTPM